MSVEGREVQKVVPPQRVIQQNSRTGRLLRFLFAPPRLGPFPPMWVATDLAGVQVYNRFAFRLAKSPPDLVTHLGLVRSCAYYAAGCPLELCDHAAARDLWQVIFQVALGSEAHWRGEDLCRDVRLHRQSRPTV